jgi:hypothetical protein
LGKHEQEQKSTYITYMKLDLEDPYFSTHSFSVFSSSLNELSIFFPENVIGDLPNLGLIIPLMHADFRLPWKAPELPNGPRRTSETGT